MPVNYLRRHAIELYITSLIHVFRRKFEISFSIDGTLEKIKIKLLGKQCELENMHSIRLLVMYLIGQ